MSRRRLGSWPAPGGPYIYRVFDADGLIYIGSTKDLRFRLSTHRREAWWAHTVVNVKAAFISELPAARVAERKAIYTEMPRWNVHEQQQLIGQFDDDQFTDYLTRWLHHKHAAERHFRVLNPLLSSRPGGDWSTIPIQYGHLLKRFRTTHGYAFDQSRLGGLKRPA